MILPVDSERVDVNLSHTRKTHLADLLAYGDQRGNDSRSERRLHQPMTAEPSCMNQVRYPRIDSDERIMVRGILVKPRGHGEDVAHALNVRKIVENLLADTLAVSVAPSEPRLDDVLLIETRRDRLRRMEPSEHELSALRTFRTPVSPGRQDGHGHPAEILRGHELSGAAIETLQEVQVPSARLDVQDVAAEHVRDARGPNPAGVHKHLTLEHSAIRTANGDGFVCVIEENIDHLGVLVHLRTESHCPVNRILVDAIR